MKKVLLTIIAIIAILPMVMAQGNRSILKIRLNDNSPITVAIDRRYYNEQNRVITIGNFPAGRHNIRVFRYSQRMNRRVLVYEGTVKLQPGVRSYMVIDRQSGIARVTNDRLIAVPKDDRDYYDWDGNRGYQDKDRYNDADIYDRDGNRYEDRTVRHDDVRGNDDRYDDRTVRDYNNNGSEMRQNDMEDLRTRVTDRITDTDKMKLMKNVLANRTYTTDQARKMASWLGFESTKLEFAKWAYDNVSDKRNYWKLEDIFTFSSSKDEFNDFIGNRR